MKDHINILLVGDEGVGKSSLISSFISRHFPQEVPPVLADAEIPPDVVYQYVKVTISDSSARLGDREVLRQKILIADSIILCYDLTRPETFDSLSQEWLPLIREMNSRLYPDARVSSYNPVVLIGTKSDLVLEEEIDLARIHIVLAAFPFVSFSFQCSAALLQSVDEIFYFGSMIVSFPLAPIFDVEVEEFTPAYRCVIDQSLEFGLLVAVRIRVLGYILYIELVIDGSNCM